VRSQPAWVLFGLALMCSSMVLRAVAIATRAASTPPAAASRRLICMRLTESR